MIFHASSPQKGDRVSSYIIFRWLLINNYTLIPTSTDVHSKIIFKLLFCHDRNWQKYDNTIILYPCCAVKLMHTYIPRFSPIEAELVVSIRWWIILPPGYISNHPTGSSLLRLTGMTLIFTTSRGHSDPGWGINAKSCRNVHLSKFGIKVPLKWYIIQESLCQQRSTKPRTHTQKI